MIMSMNQERVAAMVCATHSKQCAVCGVCGWVQFLPPLEEGLPVAQVCLQGLLHEPGLGLLGLLHLGLIDPRERHSLSTIIILHQPHLFVDTIRLSRVD